MEMARMNNAFAAPHAPAPRSWQHDLVASRLEELSYLCRNAEQILQPVQTSEIVNVIWATYKEQAENSREKRPGLTGITKHAPKNIKGIKPEYVVRIKSQYFGRYPTSKKAFMARKFAQAIAAAATEGAAA
jgi:hypothetical protein